MAKSVSSIYGDALFETAAGNQMISQVYEEVTELTALLFRDREWVQFLEYPGLSREERFLLVEKCLKDQISEELMGFLKVVMDKDRQKELLPMLLHFIRRVKEYKKIGTAHVTSAMDLEEDQKKKLEEMLIRVTGYVELQMYYKTDKEIIGGLIIRMDDRVIDSSIRTRLEQLKGRLIRFSLT